MRRDGLKIRQLVRTWVDCLHRFASGLAGARTTRRAAWCSFPQGPISSANPLIYPLGATAVVAIAWRCTEAVEGLLNPMEIGLAGNHRAWKVSQ
jgi:hypothetical protein